MRWLKRDIWKTGIALAGILLFLVLMVWVPVSSVGVHVRASELATPITVQTTPTVDVTATMTALNEEKLKGDIAQQQRTLGNWLWSNGAALISTLIVVMGGLFGFFRWRSDRADAEQKAKQAHDTELMIAADSQREAWLQEYINKMSELLSNYHLRESAGSDELRIIARVRTLTVLSRLDGRRKGSVLRFLYEAELINSRNVIVDLVGADLTGADLSEVGLNEVHLLGADLEGSDLHMADMGSAYLVYTNLVETNLFQANFSGANLFGADLTGANIAEALSLRDTVLRGVKGLTKEQLEACKAKGAIIDEDSTTSSSQSTVSPPPPSQSNDIQAPPAPPTQVSVSTPGTDESSTPSSKPGPES